MIQNPNNLWYTDTFSVYREEEYTQGNIDKKRRITVSTGNLGRVYKTGHSKTNMTTTASEMVMNDMLACDVSLDIQEGDEIVVVRGGKLGGVQEMTYFTGQPQDYFEPFGGVVPGLRHKQVPLGGERKLKKKKQTALVD